MSSMLGYPVSEEHGWCFNELNYIQQVSGELTTHRITSESEDRKHQRHLAGLLLCLRGYQWARMKGATFVLPVCVP